MLNRIKITDNIFDFANTIVNENHNIMNPKTYLKHRVNDEQFENSLKELIGVDDVDYVLLSSRSGAEEHVDTHLTHLDIYTYIIPVLVSEGATLVADKEYQLEVGQPIKINHQKKHRLDVQNDEPMVVIMASEVLHNEH